MTNRFK